MSSALNIVEVRRKQKHYSTYVYSKCAISFSTMYYLISVAATKSKLEIMFQNLKKEQPVKMK